MKQRYYEAGGKSTKLLAYRLKKQQAEKTIFKIKDPTTNSIHCKTKEIHQSFETFYKTLYSQPRIDETRMDAFFNLIKLPKVKDDQNRALIEEITDREIKNAISNLKPNKAACPDGYPSEWYTEMKDLDPEPRRRKCVRSGQLGVSI